MLSKNYISISGFILNTILLFVFHVSYSYALPNNEAGNGQIQSMAAEAFGSQDNCTIYLDTNTNICQPCRDLDAWINSNERTPKCAKIELKNLGIGSIPAAQLSTGGSIVLGAINIINLIKSVDKNPNCCIKEKKYCACGTDGIGRCYPEAELIRKGHKIDSLKSCENNSNCSDLKCAKPSPTDSGVPPSGQCPQPYSKPDQTKICRNPSTGSYSCCRADQSCKFEGKSIQCVASTPTPTPTDNPCIDCSNGVCRPRCGKDIEGENCCEKNKDFCKNDSACQEEPSSTPTASSSPPSECKKKGCNTKDCCELDECKDSKFCQEDACVEQYACDPNKGCCNHKRCEVDFKCEEKSCKDTACEDNGKERNEDCCNDYHPSCKNSEFCKKKRCSGCNAEECCDLPHCKESGRGDCASATPNASPTVSVSATPTSTASASASASVSVSGSAVASPITPEKCWPPKTYDSSGKVTGCKCGWEVIQGSSPIECKCTGKVDPITKRCDPSVIVPCNGSFRGNFGFGGSQRMTSTTQTDQLGKTAVNSSCNRTIE
jgi:hypothetical protein